MSIVVGVCMRRRDLDATDRCVANTEGAEVVFSVEFALHAGHQAGQRGRVSGRERWRQVGI